MSSIPRLAAIAMAKATTGDARQPAAMTKTNAFSFVEFETSADLKTAVEKLDGREFKGVTVQCTPDVRIRIHRWNNFSQQIRFKTSDQTLEATANAHHPGAATKSTMTAAVLHRHLAAGVLEAIASDLLVVDLLLPWTTTMLEMHTDDERPLLEATMAHLQGAMTTPTMPVALHRLPVAVIRTPTFVVATPTHDLAALLVVHMAMAVATMAMLIDDTRNTSITGTHPGNGTIGLVNLHGLTTG
jgi:hypothetical protein